MRESPIDAPLNETEWKDFVRDRSFGDLVAWGDGFPPILVPLHFAFDGHGVVDFHLHKANAVWEILTSQPRAILSVTDAIAYIPTGWNADSGADPAWSPPTSFYAAVQLCGPVEIVRQPQLVAELLTRQMEALQPEGGYNSIDTGDTPFGRLLGGIVGGRLSIQQVRARFKFGSNRATEHRRKIAQHLLERGTSDDLKARSHILRRLTVDEIEKASEASIEDADY
jgi:transcriptional regulator